MKELTRERVNTFMLVAIAATLAHAVDHNRGNLVLMVRKACDQVLNDLGISGDEAIALLANPHVKQLMSAIAESAAQAIHDAMTEDESAHEAVEIFRQYKAAGGKAN